MMRGHKHNNSRDINDTNSENKLYKCTECKLEYKEKEWAEKCRAWCNENKTCNLEITKHAIKKQ